MENNLKRSEISLLASGTQIIGEFHMKNEVHIYGKILGELHGEPGSQIILKEGSVVEGKIFADAIIVEGFVKGEIIAKKSVWVAPHGKVVGTVHTPNLQVEPGSLFQAQVQMS